MTDEVLQERNKILEAIEGQTLCTLFQSTVSTYGTRDALGRRLEDGTWTWQTWREYGEDAKRFAMALLERGLGKGDFVAIMVNNRPEHVIADTGSFQFTDTFIFLRSLREITR